MCYLGAPESLSRWVRSHGPFFRVLSVSVSANDGMRSGKGKRAQQQDEKKKSLHGDIWRGFAVFFVWCVFFTFFSCKGLSSESAGKQEEERECKK